MPAGDIAVPQLGQPQPVQPPSPLDFANASLNRQQQQNEMVNQSLLQTGQIYNTVRQQQLQRQLEGLKAISEMYGYMPRDVASQYIPQMQKMFGINMDQGSAQANAPIAPSASNGGGPGVPTFAAQTPSQPAQTLSPSNPMAMGQGGTGGGASSQPQATQPSEAILNHVNAGAPDYAGHLQKIQSQTNQLQSQMAGLSQEGPMYAQKIMPTLTGQLSALNAQREAEQFQQSQGLETSKASAEQQNKYNLPETKIQVAASKLQDLWDAFQKIPQTQTGPGAGTITGQAGSIAGKAIPEVVFYNKLREAYAVSAAIARNPENPRPSPQDIQDELKNLPSAGDATPVAVNLFNAAARDLQTTHKIITQGAQAAAGAFGGRVQPAQAPSFNFNKPATSNLPPITQGMVRIQASDGSIHDVPSLAAARKIDKGAKLYNR